jgi:DNA-binding NtrC family response regulator
MPDRILVVDDEESMCRFMQIMLSREGYDVQAEPSSRRALDKIKQEGYDLVIADLMMPEMSGLELLAEGRKERPETQFMVMTAFASVDTAIEALKSGAIDYITKPFKIDEIKIAIRKFLDQKRLTQENVSLKEHILKESSFDNFLGRNPAVVKMKEMAAKVAATDSTILIRGESGTGKDLIAHAIHNHSRRLGRPFIALNCGALPETLLESELFGHTRGAFTGAVKDKDGLFKAADTGTMFLDEIGETSPAIQVKLLRALEEKQITPVGATKPVPTDVRLLAATNADLEELVKVGRFRADLYYRLNVISVFLPPLRERLDDLPELAQHFLERACVRLNLPPKTLSPAALDLLRTCRWSGNVRELQNVLERAALFSKSAVLELKDFPERLSEPSEVSPVSEPTPASPTMESIEKAYIYWVLNQTDWNKSKAAEILGIDNSTLYRKIHKYNFAERRGAEKTPV